MNSKVLTSAARLRGGLIGIAALGCLAVMGYGFFMSQQAAGGGGESRLAADDMRLLARQIATSAWQSAQGRESTFSDLAQQVARFEEQKSQIQSAQLSAELSQVDVAWQPIRRSAQTLVDAGQRIVYVQAAAEQLGRDLEPMQLDFAAVIDSLKNQGASPSTVAVAHRNLWLSERINRDVNRILQGDSASAQAADEFRTDSAELLRNIEALTRGDALLGVSRVTDPEAIEALSSGFRKFSAVSTAVDRIAGSADELREAARARDAILSSDGALATALASLVFAVDKLAVGGLAQRSSVVALFIAPGVVAVVLLFIQFFGQGRRTAQLEQGISQVNRALDKIAGGDLTVQVDTDNICVVDIARQINSSTGRQREMVQDIRAPFELSVEEINKIGVSARGLVEKGKELTRSVGESITAATEMVRASEEIKTSTAEAARTSDRNCQQVARGYELTKDMSKASVDVRESVQETSKSAKRQGELIQSVTAAAEYIQALNTKISVVAINTRIEAEKAGEYGRPFLGIAEAIADLLREAGDEGRKIISEVRTLQNMSAENLASMENTVGTVVTILEYIERLDGSLEEINSGSDAISSIIRSVDDAAGQSAVSALHMNNAMVQMRERNAEIATFSDSTRLGVARLQRCMRDASESLAQFRVEVGSRHTEMLSRPGDLEKIGAAPRTYREEDMSALETTELATASV